VDKGSLPASLGLAEGVLLTVIDSGVLVHGDAGRKAAGRELLCSAGRLALQAASATVRQESENARRA
jgi:hypothetical protein